jgi:predicted double-glycine peptidase
MLTPVRIRRRTLLALVFLLPGPVARAATATAPSISSGTLIEVPYFTQTEQLCGGAALAMVLRYWGERDVFPQDFAELVEPNAPGIRTGRLTAAVVARGWTATPVAPTDDVTAADLLNTHVARGRPLIALVEDRPGVYHYVVVVGVTPESVVWHDPARSPYEVVDRRAFERAWSAAGRWLLLVLPPAAGLASPADAGRVASVSVAVPAATRPDTAVGAADSHGLNPCAPLVADAITRARAGARDEAERGLLAATTLCPANSAAWRELAGLRLVQRRFLESAALAEQALSVVPTDRNAWQVLATSRYASGDLHGALNAWNEVGQPITDAVSITGVERMPQPVVVNQLGLEARELLTSDALTRAARRLDDLPSVSSARVRYTMQGDGRAAVEAAVDEASVLPKGLMGWAAVGVRAIFQKELQVDVASPLRLGEEWSPAYRWSSRRPRVRLELDTPAPGGWPGVIRLDAFWERQTYQHALLGDGLFEQSRRRAGVTWGNWAAGWLRWEAGAAFDTIADDGFVSLDGVLNTRWFDDQLAVLITANRWLARGDAQAFSSGEVVTTWRSTTASDGPALTVTGGYTTVSNRAPLAVWPGASSGLGRGALLRAHPVLTDDVLIGEVFGRRLAFSSVEYERPVWSSPYGAVGVAGFVDSAKAWQRIDAHTPSPLHTDVGAGVRLKTGGAGGTVRLDFGYGLRDGKMKLSAGYVMPWGER